MDRWVTHRWVIDLDLVEKLRVQQGQLFSQILTSKVQQSSWSERPPEQIMGSVSDPHQIWRLNTSGEWSKVKVHLRLPGSHAPGRKWAEWVRRTNQVPPLLHLGKDVGAQPVGRSQLSNTQKVENQVHQQQQQIRVQLGYTAVTRARTHARTHHTRAHTHTHYKRLDMSSTSDTEFDSTSLHTTFCMFVCVCFLCM